MATDVNGLMVENAVTKSDKAAMRMLGSRWSRKLPRTLLLSTNFCVAPCLHSFGFELSSTKGQWLYIQFFQGMRLTIFMDKIGLLANLQSSEEEDILFILGITHVSPQETLQR